VVPPAHVWLLVTPFLVFFETEPWKARAQHGQSQREVMTEHHVPLSSTSRLPLLHFQGGDVVRTWKAQYPVAASGIDLLMARGRRIGLAHVPLFVRRPVSLDGPGEQAAAACDSTTDGEGAHTEETWMGGSASQAARVVPIAVDSVPVPGAALHDSITVCSCSWVV